jgi:prenyltransferase beta subunit
LSQYRVIKKEKKRIRKRLSPLIVTSYKKYVRVRIEEYDPINDTLLENKKRFIIINDNNLQSYMNTLKIDTNDYYNRNIGLIPNLI